jgi:hypothetical protein
MPLEVNVFRRQLRRQWRQGASTEDVGWDHGQFEDGRADGRRRRCCDAKQGERAA